MVHYMVEVLQGLLGISVLIGILYLMSNRRSAVDWKLVGMGVLLQFVVAIIMLKVPVAHRLLDEITRIFIALMGFADEGGRFVFGGLYDSEKVGYVFFVKIAPTIIFFSALSSVLYYLGILQRIVWCLAWLMQKTMRLSGTESLAAAANIFLGQTEAPLLIKPYISQMSKSELLCLMTGGMATIAGGVFAAYITFLGGEDQSAKLLFGKHLITASLLSAPAAVVAAKLLHPETESFSGELKINRESLGANVFDAAMLGTTQGVKLAINVMAALMVFIAGVALLNYIFGEFIGSHTGLNAMVSDWTDGRYEQFDLNFMFGIVFSPLAWLIGVNSSDVLSVGQLLGEKMVLNEFIAYIDLAEMKSSGEISSERSVIITTYALCGFANFSSIGIQIGGISAIAPDRRVDLSKLALKSLLGGMVACLLTGAIAGIVI